MWRHFRKCSAPLQRIHPITRSLKRLLSTSSCEVTVGRSEISFSTGKLAKVADGSVFATSRIGAGGDGSTTVLATVVSNCSTHHLGPREVGLMEVHYRERAWAMGDIPHTRSRRELGASHAEVKCEADTMRRPRPELSSRMCSPQILTSRAIDRSVRALFPRDWLDDTEIVVTLHTHGTKRSMARIRG